MTDATRKESMTATPGSAELLTLADFVLLEANGPGKFTSMRFTHEKWMIISAALRLAAKPTEEVREACAKIAIDIGFAARLAVRSATSPRERSKAIGAEDAAQKIAKEIAALSTTQAPKP